MTPPRAQDEAPASASHENGDADADDDQPGLDAELLALLDREIDSQWGGAGGSRPEPPPARSERIASGGNAGGGPLSEELKVRHGLGGAARNCSPLFAFLQPPEPQAGFYELTANRIAQALAATAEALVQIQAGLSREVRGLWL